LLAYGQLAAGIVQAHVSKALDEVAKPVNAPADESAEQELRDAKRRIDELETRIVELQGRIAELEAGRGDAGVDLAYRPTTDRSRQAEDEAEPAEEDPWAISDLFGCIECSSLWLLSS
jgi:hypothetical protein